MDKAGLNITFAGYPNNEPLVLLHGFLGDHHDWQTVITALSSRFFCIIPDLPGHGDSAHINISDPGFSDCCQLIDSALSALNIEHYHLLGYSLGGRLALHMAQRVPAKLLSLTLESCHPGLTSVDEQQQRWQNDSVWANRLAQLPIRQFLDLWYQQGVFAELSAQQRQQLIDKRAHNNPLSLANCYQATSLAKQQNLWTIPQQLNCECHYILGENDKKFSQLAQTWQQTGAPLKLHHIANAGHNVHLAQPQAFSQVVLAL